MNSRHQQQPEDSSQGETQSLFFQSNDNSVVLSQPTATIQIENEVQFEIPDDAPPTPPNKWLKAIVDAFKHIFPVYREDRIGSVNFPEDNLDENGFVLKTYHKDENAYIDHELYINDPKVRFMALIGLRHEKLYDSDNESFFWNVLRNIIGDTRRKQDLIENIFSAGYNILKTVLSVAINLPMAIVKTVVEFLPEVINRLSFQAMKASYKWMWKDNNKSDKTWSADLKYAIPATFGLILTAIAALVFFVSGIARFVTRAIMSPMQAVKEAYLFGETLPQTRNQRFNALFDILGVTLGLVLAGLSLAVSIGFYAAVPYALVHYAPQVIAYATLHNMPHLLQLGQLITTVGSVVSQVGSSVAASLSALLGINVSATVTTIGLLASAGLAVPVLGGIGKWVAGKISDWQFGKYQAARAELIAKFDDGVTVGCNSTIENSPTIQALVNNQVDQRVATQAPLLAVEMNKEQRLALDRLEHETHRRLTDHAQNLNRFESELNRQREELNRQRQEFDQEKNLQTQDFNLVKRELDLEKQSLKQAQASHQRNTSSLLRIRLGQEDSNSINISSNSSTSTSATNSTIDNFSPSRSPLASSPRNRSNNLDNQDDDQTLFEAINTTTKQPLHVTMFQQQPLKKPLGALDTTPSTLPPANHTIGLANS